MTRRWKRTYRAEIRPARFGWAWRVTQTDQADDRLPMSWEGPESWRPTQRWAVRAALAEIRRAKAADARHESWTEL